MFPRRLLLCCVDPKDITTKLVLNASRTVDILTAQSKFYGQAERAISTGKLHVLPRFNLQPINLVVFQGPSFPLLGWEISS